MNDAAAETYLRMLYNAQSPKKNVPARLRPIPRPTAEQIPYIDMANNYTEFSDPLSQLGAMAARLPETLIVSKEPNAYTQAMTTFARPVDGERGVASLYMTSDLANPYTMGHELRHVGLMELANMANRGALQDITDDEREALRRAISDERDNEYTVESADEPLVTGTRTRVGPASSGFMSALFGERREIAQEPYNKANRYSGPLYNSLDAGTIPPYDRGNAPTDQAARLAAIAGFLGPTERDEDGTMTDARREQYRRDAQILNGLAQRAPGMGF